MALHHSLSIAVICGGPSKEAEVSRSTAKGIVKALQENYSSVHLIELDDQVDKTLRNINPDVVFPAVHGEWGEDGILQGLLTICGFPYVGSDVRASMLAMDKVLAKQIFQLQGLPVAQSMVIHQGQNLAEKAREILEKLGSQVVTKPASEGSSLGVSFADNPVAVQAGLELALNYGSRVLVEERIMGTEITASILEHETAEALPVIEIRTPPGAWYDFEHRYQPGLSEHVIPAPLPRAQYQRVQEIALLAHQALGCRDLSRVDFVVPPVGEPILLEVNTMPGMTPTSLFPDAAQAAGIAFPLLVSLLVERAYARASLGSRHNLRATITDGLL